jgi:hypothetical protein
VGTTFSSVDEFLAATTPGDPTFKDFRSLIGSGPYKGENIDVGQLGLYAQDELLASERLNLTFGVRVDFPMYYTEPIDNPFSRGLTALDADDNPETVDQSDLPGAKALFSPRVGFNWNASGDRKTQVRGGTGIFTGRVPFVWIGNVISNPGANPNLYPVGPVRETQDSSTLAQSFDLNAMVTDFKWPQTWVSDIAIDQQLGRGFLATLEAIYGNDLNNVIVRNADLVPPVRTLPDGRPYFGGAGANELNPDGDAGIYVLDNTSEGYNFNITAQLRKAFEFGLTANVAYSYTQAKNNLRSTEIASVLWQSQPIRGDPNRPELSWSEFGQRHRIVGSATYVKPWSERFRTSIGLFVEVAEGNRYAGSGGNRYSFIYSGDVNGDSYSNDLIYIPRDQSDIVLADCPQGCGSNVTPQQQWDALNAFIEQDPYLSQHRGEIAERNGAVNPWYNNVDLRIMQDIGFGGGAVRHNFQVSFDILNVGNLISSDWGVRKVATSSATSPLRLAGFDAGGAPMLQFTGPAETFIDDPNLNSRWRAQLGLRYFFE